MDWRRRYEYGVSKEEVERFVAENECVREFLGRFLGGTWFEYARSLAVFFKWLRLREGLKLSAKEFLDEHLRRRGLPSVEDRRWASRLVLRFSRDNPDFKKHAGGYKYGLMMAVKSFCDYYEVPLTTSKGLFGRREGRKYKRKQMTVEVARKVLGALHQREKTICLMMLQSGQSINAILNRLNGQLAYFESLIRAGASRIRLDFTERKGNGFAYFSFISKDAIQELQKWLAIRRKWLEKTGKSSDKLFITRSGKPYTIDYFEVVFTRRLKSKGLKNGPFDVVSHMFRKLFKTESSPPERGISSDYVEFMMGHLSGIQSVGGVYDRTPEINPNVVQKEYEKLEPFINIYSGKSEMEGLDLSEEDLESLKHLLQMMKEGKIKIES